MLAVAYALVLTMGIYRTLWLRDLLGVAQDTALMTGGSDGHGGHCQRHRLDRDGGPGRARPLAVPAREPYQPPSGPGPDERAHADRGIFLEPIPLVFLLLPVLLPVAQVIGMDPVHLAIIFNLNCSLGMIHPPIGLNILVVSTISETSVWEVTKAVLPFFLALRVLTLIVTEIPWLVMWSPNLLLKQVLDPGCFGDGTHYRSMVSDTVAAAKRVRPAPGVEEILMPGELEARARAMRQRHGVTLPDATWQDLAKVAKRFAIQLPEPLA